MAAVLRYPYSAITKSTDYLQLDIVQYTPAEKGLVRGPGFAKNTNERDVGNVAASNTVAGLNGSILLPIPANIQDGNSVRYADDSLNGIVASAVAKTQAVMTADYGQGVSEMVNKTLKNLQTGFAGFFNEQGGATKDLIIRALAAQSVNIFGGNVTPDQLLARQSGSIFNPNMELLFNGVTLRAFKFSFKLTPRNSTEAEQVKLIIRSLKRNMAPKSVNTTYIKTPNIFELRYRRGNLDHPFLHKFKKCALTDMAVNYTGDNVYATYGDATPVSMIMDLTFRELEPIYESDYAVDIGTDREAELDTTVGY